MNKSILIALVFVVILAGTYFAYDSMSTEDNSPAQNNTAQQNVNEQEGFTNTQNTTQPKKGQTKSLADLSTQGAQKCNLSVTPEGAPDNAYYGIYYTDGSGKYFTELTIDKTNTKYYTLISNPTLYTWSGQNNQGIKQPVQQGTAAEQNLNQEEFQNLYDFDCSPWQVNSSFFVPPANITFKDMPTSITNPYSR